MPIRTGLSERWLITFSDIEGNSIKETLGHAGGPVISKLKAIKEAKRLLAESRGSLVTIESVEVYGAVIETSTGE